MTIDVENALPFFADTAGKPLQGGLIYYGAAGQNPAVATNQITVYWDAAQTQPVAQPVAVSNGLTMRNGTPARVYVPSAYSRLVLDAAGRMVSFDASLAAPLRSDLSASSGSALIGFQQTGSGVLTGDTVQAALRGILTMRQFTGFDPTGASDSTSAINTALAQAKAQGFSKVIVGAPGTSIRIDGNINWPADYVGVDWQGAFIDATRLASGYTINPQNTITDPTSRVARNQAHPMENFVVQGPGNVASTGFVNFNDGTTSAQTIAGIHIRNGGSWNFLVHANYGIGAFFETFTNWAFDTVNGGYSGTFINMPSGSANSGERNSFVGCRLGMCASAGISQANGGADTRFINCSFNAINPTLGTGRFITQTNGMISLTDCHIEGTSDSDYWVSISGVNSILAWERLTVIVDANKTTKPIFNCDSSVTSGAMVQGTTLFGDGSTYPLPLIDGTGRVISTGPSTLYYTGTAPYYIASSLNLLADGGFETNSLATDGWVAASVGGGTAPAVSNTNPHTGTYSVKFLGQVGVTNTCTLTKPCKPGQSISGQLWAATTGHTGTSMTFYIEIRYLNANGGVISSYPVNGVSGWTTTTAYTLLPLLLTSASYRAPAGTVNVAVFCSAFGTASGSPAGYIDDVVVNVQ